MSTDPAIDSVARQRPGLRIPRHLGVIMDGNGRWARARGKLRTEGHIAGVRALRRLVELSTRYGVKHVTAFSFSSENWTRPRDEVNFILGLVRRFVASDLEQLVRNNVHVRIIGKREELDEGMQRLIANAETRTANNTGLELIIAFNYGGKAEITDATRRIAEAVQAGRLKPEDISEATIERELYTAGTPDPDLIIRTSGERRFSNFLLWQSAYSELVFIDEYWPDFDEDIFVRVLEEYSGRERRFGGVEAQVS
ncbi:MAG TPA: isoprenyl transferase [Devosiaceae bacterium]|jgi:undecaprenyl diphosphate synthase